MYRRLFKYVIPEKHLYNTITYYTNKNITPILDYVVEHNTDPAVIHRFMDKKLQLFEDYPNSYHSLKLSSLNFDTYKTFLLAKSCKQNNIKLLIDAEEYDVQDEVKTITNKLIEDGYDYNIFKTYQMYRKDMFRELVKDIYFHQTHDLIHNIKLVRGAYIFKDMNKNIIHETKEITDVVFDDAIELLIEEMNQTSKINVIVATHNMDSFEKIRYIPSNYNIQHAALMGMEEKFDDKARFINRMVHIPFGPLHKSYPYMFRRLVENNPLNDQIIEYKQKYDHYINNGRESIDYGKDFSK